MHGNAVRLEALYIDGKNSALSSTAAPLLYHIALQVLFRHHVATKAKRSLDELIAIMFSQGPLEGAFVKLLERRHLPGDDD